MPPKISTSPLTWSDLSLVIFTMCLEALEVITCNPLLSLRCNSPCVIWSDLGTIKHVISVFGNITINPPNTSQIHLLFCKWNGRKPSVTLTKVCVHPTVPNPETFSLLANNINNDNYLDLYSAFQETQGRYMYLSTHCYSSNHHDSTKCV